jgi:hypothetical protein
MKQKIIILFILLLGTMRSFSTEIPGEIVSAFKSGNATQLAKYFNQTIELTLFEKEEIYSKTQAEIILRDFFSNNPPNQFQIIHQGGKETSKFAIGSLVSGTNKYRITLLLKTVNTGVLIYQLRIEYEHVE